MDIDHKYVRNANLLRLHILILCLLASPLAYFSGIIKVLKTNNRGEVSNMENGKPSQSSTEILIKQQYWN